MTHNTCQWLAIPPKLHRSPLSCTWSGHPRLDESHRMGGRREMYATEARMLVLGRICYFVGDRRDSCWCGHSAELQLGSLFGECEVYWAGVTGSQGWRLLSRGA